MNASLRIDRLQTTCHVAGDGFAAAIRDRAARACRDHVPVVLGGARWLDGDDESVWIVRRIDLDVATSLEAAPDQIASSIASALGRALAKALNGDGDGTNAIRFRNRAAYVSRFLADVADGSAWTRWYFAPFSGWKLLPRSSAIRSALIADRVIGLDALRTLPDWELEKVAACLTVEDERLVLRVFAGGATDTADFEPAMLAAITEPSTVDARRPLIRFLQTGNPALDSEVEPTNAPSPEVFTKFGGIALLLRDVKALPWAAWTAGWSPPIEEVTAEACLTWLTLALCSGNAQSNAFLSDQFWRDVLGIPATLTLRDVARWLRDAGKERRRALVSQVRPDRAPRSERRWLALSRRIGISREWCAALASLARLVYTGFARRLPGFASSSIEYLWRNFLQIDALVEHEADRVIVRCGRAPLHLVLALTGMTRGTVAGFDVRGRPILVFSRE